MVFFHGILKVRSASTGVIAATAAAGIIAAATAAILKAGTTFAYHGASGIRRGTGRAQAAEIVAFIIIGLTARYRAGRSANAVTPAAAAAIPAARFWNDATKKIGRRGHITDLIDRRVDPRVNGLCHFPAGGKKNDHGRHNTGGQKDIFDRALSSLSSHGFMPPIYSKYITRVSKITSTLFSG